MPLLWCLRHCYCGYVLKQSLSLVPLVLQKSLGTTNSGMVYFYSCLQVSDPQCSYSIQPATLRPLKKLSANKEGTLFSNTFSSLKRNSCRKNMANTNPEERRIALSIIAHCEIVWLWPQDLHNVLIELCLLFLYRET